jgi:molecular chaperone DnaK
MKLGQAIYEKEQQNAASPGAEAPEGEAAGGGSDEEVVDAEFSEVDENKG